MTIEARATALFDSATAMLAAARQLDRTAQQWRVSHAAERDLRASRDAYLSVQAQQLTDPNASLLGLPVEIDDGAEGIELVLEGGDRLARLNQPGGRPSIEIRPQPVRRRFRSGTDRNRVAIPRV